jgi:hypothetical protein
VGTSTFEVVQALVWEHGVRLSLNRAKTRVFLDREAARKVPEEIRRAIRQNHDDLLRGALFLDGVSRFCRYMTEKKGADPHGPEYAAGIAGLGAGGAHERLNEAWDEDLDRFKEALADYLRAGAREFKLALEKGAARPAAKGPAIPHQPSVPPRKGVA